MGLNEVKHKTDEQTEHVIQDIPTREEAKKEAQTIFLKLLLCKPDDVSAAEFVRMIEIVKRELALK